MLMNGGWWCEWQQQERVLSSHTLHLSSWIGWMRSRCRIKMAMLVLMVMKSVTSCYGWLVTPVVNLPPDATHPAVSCHVKHSSLSRETSHPIPAMSREIPTHSPESDRVFVPLASVEPASQVWINIRASVDYHTAHHPHFILCPFYHSSVQRHSSNVSRISSSHPQSQQLVHRNRIVFKGKGQLGESRKSSGRVGRVTRYRGK